MRCVTLTVASGLFSTRRGVSFTRDAAVPRSPRGETVLPPEAPPPPQSSSLSDLRSVQAGSKILSERVLFTGAGGRRRSGATLPLKSCSQMFWLTGRAARVNRTRWANFSHEVHLERAKFDSKKDYSSS